MKSLARRRLSGLALLVLAATPAAAQEPPPGDGPRGSSQGAPGEARYDEVGYAGAISAPGVSAISAALEQGSYAEVTALDSGRTILVRILVGRPAAGRIVGLSTGALGALAASGEPVPIRIRRVAPGPQDVAQLLAGQPAGMRADAPDALLVPLRRRLGVSSAQASPTIKPAGPPKPRPAAVQPASAPATPRPAPDRPVAAYFVQVAALSDRRRAEALARQLGGGVVAAGALFRVQMGPFAGIDAADRARARAVQAGYPDARRYRAPGR